MNLKSSSINIDGVEWVIVRTVSTEFEAELIAGRLRAHDIPSRALSQVDSTRNFTVGALAVAKVFVPAEFVEQANEVLSNVEPPDEL